MLQILVYFLVLEYPYITSNYFIHCAIGILQCVDWFHLRGRVMQLPRVSHDINMLWRYTGVSHDVNVIH